MSRSRRLGGRTGRRAIVGAALVLGAAVGINAVAFAVLYDYLLRPLPVLDADALRVVYSTPVPSEPPRWQLSYATFRALSDADDVFSATGGMATTDVHITIGERHEVLRAGLVSPGYFDVLGVRPQSGRAFLAGSDPLECVVSRSLSRRLPIAGGGTQGGMAVEGRPVTVVGVLPASFEQLRQDVDLWLPLVPHTPFLEEQVLANAGYRLVRMVGRLRPGLALDEAAERLKATADESGVPLAEGADARVELRHLRSDITDPRIQTMAVLIQAAGALLLLLAAANVTNVMLLRAVSREREVATRAILGAGGLHLIWLVLREGLAVALFSVLLAVPFAVTTRAALAGFAPGGYSIGDVPLGMPVLLVSVLIALACAMAAALPAVGQALAPNLSVAVGSTPYVEQPPRRQRLRVLLLCGQVFLAQAVLVNAGLALKSVAQIRSLPIGFDPEGVVTARVSLPSERYSSERLVQFYRSLHERFSGEGSVLAISSDLPSPNPGHTASVAVEGKGRFLNSGEHPTPGRHLVSETFFDVLRVAVLHGRGLEPQDAQEPGGVVISERMAEWFWDGPGALGQRLSLERKPRWREVVGVAADIWYGPPDVPQKMEIFEPILGRPVDTFYVLARSGAKSGATARRLVDTLEDLEPTVAPTHVATLDDLLLQATARYVFASIILALLGSLALFIGTVGTWAVFSYAMESQRRGLAVRRALGARTRDLARTVLADLALVAALGMVPGVLFGSWAAGGLRTPLYATQVDDAAVRLGAILVVVLGVCVPCWFALRRALTSSPALELRVE